MKSLVQENRDLKQELEIYKNNYEKLKKEFNLELAKLSEPFNNSLEMREQIHKMKCCGNCKHEQSYRCKYDDNWTCNNLSKWEIKD